MSKGSLFLLKELGIRAFGPACFLSSLPACLAAGGLGKPPASGRGKLTNNYTHISTNNRASHLSKIPSVPCPPCILSILPHRSFLAASGVGAVFSPISQIRKWSQVTRSCSF